MQLTLHATHPTPHGASRLVQAMSAWWVKTRRPPSRHCRDARVYGHTTTAIHENEYTSSPHPFLRLSSSARCPRRPRPVPSTSACSDLPLGRLTVAKNLRSCWPWRRRVRRTQGGLWCPSAKTCSKKRRRRRGSTRIRSLRVSGVSPLSWIGKHIQKQMGMCFL